MPSDKWDKMIVRDLSGGMNSMDKPVIIRENQGRLIKNGYVEVSGAVRPRLGYSKDVSVSAGGNIRNGIRYYMPGYQKKTVVVVKSGNYNILKYKASSSSWTTITGGTDMLSGRDVELFVVRGVLFAYDGVTCKYWTGSGTAADIGFIGGSTVVVPWIMTMADHRLFVVESTDPNTVLVSRTDGWGSGTTPTDLSFGATDFFKIPQLTNSYYGIRGMLTLANGELLIARERDCWLLTGSGPTNYDFSKKSGEVGTVSRWGMVETEYGNVILVGSDQIYEIYITDEGIAKHIPIGQPIKNLLNAANMEKSFAFYDPRIESVCIGYQNGTLVWNVRHRAWSVWDYSVYRAYRCFAPIDRNDIIFCMSGSEYLYKNQTGYDDDGTDYEFEYESQYYDMGDFTATKAVRGLKILSEAPRDTICDYKILTNGGVTSIKSGTLYNNLNVSKYDADKWDKGRWVGDVITVGTDSADDETIGNHFSFRITTSDIKNFSLFGLAFQHKIVSDWRRGNANG